MHRITQSIEIKLPRKKVFAFLKDIEARLELNPFYKVYSFEKTTDGGIGVGTRFKIALLSDYGMSKYESEIAEFVENERIAIKDVNGRLMLTLTLKDMRGGTLLTHDEEFIIPEEIFHENEEANWPQWLNILKSLTLESIKFDDRKRQKKMEEITKNLRNNLRKWLNIIKERLETEGA
mgnify:FL=1